MAIVKNCILTKKINGEGVKRCQSGAKVQWGGIKGRQICVRMEIRQGAAGRLLICSEKNKDT